MTTEMQPLKAERWHIDRGIPIALILAFFIQAITVGYFMGGLDSRVEQLEHITSNNRADDQRLTTVETEVRNIKNDIGSIKMDQREIKRSVTAIERAVVPRITEGP